MGEEDMSWYKVEFTPQEVVDGKALQMFEAFSEIFLRLGGPKDAGLFSEGMSSTSVKNEHYFSPGAVRIAHALIALYNGVPCKTPKRSEVAFLVTDASASAIPFASEDALGK